MINIAGGWMTMNNIEQLKLRIDTKTKRSVLWRWFLQAQFLLIMKDASASILLCSITILKIAYKNKPEALQKRY